MFGSRYIAQNVFLTFSETLTFDLLTWKKISGVAMIGENMLCMWKNDKCKNVGIIDI